VTDDVARRVTDWLEERGFIDEGKMARRLAERALHERGYGRRRARAWLLAQGIPSSTADAALDEHYSPEGQEEAARRLVEKRGIPATRREQARLRRFLLARGFEPELASRLVRGYAVDDVPAPVDD